MSAKNYPAKIISFLFHPLLLPTYAVFLIFVLPTYISNYQFEYKRIVLIIIFILTFVFPVLVLMVMLNIKTISSLTLNKRKERIYPYALATIIYIAAYYIIMNFSVGIPAYITNFVLTSTIIIFVLMLINFKIKVSAHMAGIGGFISFFYVFILKENLYEYPFAILEFNMGTLVFLSGLLILAAIIASSRLSLNAHKADQIWIGFFTGLLIGLLNLFF